MLRLDGTYYVRTFELPNMCICGTCGFIMRFATPAVPVRGTSIHAWCENALCSDKDLHVPVPMRIHEIEMNGARND